MLLDEPAGGLDTAESQWLGERLRRIRDSGVTILLVDHDMHLVLNLCDQIHVLDFGGLIASGPPEREGRPPRRRGLPRQHPRRASRRRPRDRHVDQPPASTPPPLFECRAVEAGYGRVNIVRPFDLTADGGTVVAVLGPNGAGKTTLLSTIAGCCPARAARSASRGHELKRGRAAAASRAGLVLVPDDRSLFTTLTVRENLRAACGRGKTRDRRHARALPALASAGSSTRRAVRRRAADAGRRPRTRAAAARCCSSTR